ncbi:NAD-dependent epimerase/dehydratase family protein, putative [Leptolyngbya sp. NIES-3755]|nr:NAD-dependent epimerase/dehydratase family protein, putative [Leptolyngbya sp. NIES-3755]
MPAIDGVGVLLDDATSKHEAVASYRSTFARLYRRQLVQQALEQGHLVTAFARDPNRLDLQHPNLKLVQGDVLDLESVQQAVQNQDVVLCSLGSGQQRTGTVRSEGT